ncbi:alpha/beta hydrolase [candidate division KSB1 bacterium]|nr:alpha/beta hydrolase [candidate division KSB1 bacterium]
MEKLIDYCAPGAKFEESYITTSAQVSLRVIHFSPPVATNKPVILFVAGWISQISAWHQIIKELSKEFEVYYIESREKISSLVTGKVNYGVEEIGQDIVALVSQLELQEKQYILFGSSLGATAILDCSQWLPKKPLCLVLIGPNAVFRVPPVGMVIIRLFPPRMYMVLKPIVKWYLKTFRLDIHADFAQYRKYCAALDAADPWKLKNGAIQLAKYKVWDILPAINIPTLIAGASKDTLHEKENLEKMVSLLPKAVYIDLETNKKTHETGMVTEFKKYLATLS